MIKLTAILISDIISMIKNHELVESYTHFSSADLITLKSDERFVIYSANGIDCTLFYYESGEKYVSKIGNSIPVLKNDYRGCLTELVLILDYESEIGKV